MSELRPSDERTCQYVVKLEALAESARFRALQAGGSVIYHLEHGATIGDLRAYVEALCRHKRVPVFKATNKRQLAEFALRHL